MYLFILKFNYISCEFNYSAGAKYVCQQEVGIFDIRTCCYILHGFHYPNKVDVNHQFHILACLLTRNSKINNQVCLITRCKFSQKVVVTVYTLTNHYIQRNVHYHISQLLLNHINQYKNYFSRQKVGIKFVQNVRGKR